MGKITKEELIEQIAASEEGMTKAMAGHAVNIILAHIVSVANSGKYADSEPVARKEVTIPAKKHIKFKAGKSFRIVIQD